MNLNSKIYVVCMTLICSYGVVAQSLPELSYKDFGYSKQVKQSEAIYYSLEGESIEKIEQVTKTFNSDGNLQSDETHSLLDNSWSKSQYFYKKGHLRSVRWTHSKPYLNRTHIFFYDKQGRIIEEKIRFNEGRKHLKKYIYKEGKLSQIEADIDGTQSVTVRYYSAKGKLYKETRHQKVPNQADIVTHSFYLEDKEILSYLAPQSHFFANVYPNNSTEIQFKLIEDSIAQSKLLKGIRRFDKEAPKDNLPFGLQQYSNQTLQFYDKNKDKLIPYRMRLYFRDAHKQVIAEAEVHLKTKTISNIGFFKIDYDDGTSTGSTSFDEQIRNQLAEYKHILKTP